MKNTILITEDGPEILTVTRMEPMSDHKGQIVRATAGRDKEDIFCVMGVEKETGRLLLADGKRRESGPSQGEKARGMWRRSPSRTAPLTTPPSRS